MVDLFYKAVPVLADQDKIGGSATSSNERGRLASTVQSTAIVAPDHRLLNENCGLLSGRTFAIEGGQHWRKTVRDYRFLQQRLQMPSGNPHCTVNTPHQCPLMVSSAPLCGSVSTASPLSSVRGHDLKEVVNR